MESVVLVDSSVFIRLLREGRDPAQELVSRAGESDLATCGMVRMEVLRGMKSPKARRALEEFFEAMRFVPSDAALWKKATDLAWRMDRAGRVLPLQDIFIAACAFNIDAAVLAFDSHYAAIPGLRVISDLDGFS
jgi:predicted nucleic acid-binding protein